MRAIPTHAAILVLALVAGAAQGQSLRETTSLGRVPASASMYSTTLRTGEQFQRFLESRAFAKLKSLPLVQIGLVQLHRQWEENDDLAEFREFVSREENRKLGQVLVDAISHEVFVYGDARYGKWLATISQFSNRLNLAQMKAAQQGVDAEETMPQAIAEILEGDPDLLRMPGTVIGFRVSDAKAATRELARLESAVQKWIENERPELKDRFSRQQINNGSFLTLQLDGTLIDWKNLLRNAELESSVLDKLAARLQQTTLSLNLGLYDNFLLFALGEDDAQLRSFGQGELLADDPRMAPLAKFFDRPVTSIGYTSGEFRVQLAAVNERLNQFVEMVRTGVAFLPTGDDVKDDLVKDAEQFARQLKDLQPPLGAIVGVSFEADGGYESVAYDWSEHRKLDDSKPLTILDHVGGDPIGFFASRRKKDSAEEEFVRQWVVKVGGYIERIALPMLDQEQQDLFQEIKNAMLPLLARLNVANQQKLSPAMADGQSAIILDAQLSKAQWHTAMPPAKVAVALPELICVWGVSDPELLREAAAEYFDVFQASFTAMSEIMPDKVPPVRLPTPIARQFDVGTVYYYEIPPFLGLDASIAPNAGLSNDTLVMSWVPLASQRVLGGRSLQRTGPLEQMADRPVALAWQFKMHRFVQFIRPWTDYGLQLAEEQQTVDPMIATHMAAVMDVMECIRTCSGIAYFEDGALVYRSRTELQDLKP